MKTKNPVTEELIAPCGMNCAICSRYLAHVNNIKRSQCIGCRPRNARCTYLFAKCTGINHTVKEDAVFCFKCDRYPCMQIRRIDDRYRNNYKMSMIENLELIQQKGISRFIQEQYEKYRCKKCGGLISIHNRKCFHCDTITKLVAKES